MEVGWEEKDIYPLFSVSKTIFLYSKLTIVKHKQPLTEKTFCKYLLNKEGLHILLSYHYIILVLNKSMFKSCNA